MEVAQPLACDPAMKRVLIIDDEENIGRSLKLILERKTSAAL